MPKSVFLFTHHPETQSRILTILLAYITSIYTLIPPQYYSINLYYSMMAAMVEFLGLGLWFVLQGFFNYNSQVMGKKPIPLWGMCLIVSQMALMAYTLNRGDNYFTIPCIVAWAVFLYFFWQHSPKDNDWIGVCVMGLALCVLRIFLFPKGIIQFAEFFQHSIFGTTDLSVRLLVTIGIIATINGLFLIQHPEKEESKRFFLFVLVLELVFIICLGINLI